MQKNTTARTVFIVAIILACVFGVIGFPTSGAALMQNLKSNIRLGLDLKGGSYLVLEVQVQDAVRAEALQGIERLKDSFRKQNIQYASIDANDPQTVEQADSVQIDIKGVPATEATALRSMVNDGFPDWVLTAASSTDFYMRMKPTSLIQLKKDTVDRSIQTITNRINTIGVTEPSVQQYGRSSDKYEILVQLPGVDDPQQVKDMIGTVANLEISSVQDGPFPSRDAGMAQHGGVLPPNTVLDKALPRGTAEGEQWYLVSRLPVITGR
jgi:preprotein translocase subunit SecD